MSKTFTPEQIETAKEEVRELFGNRWNSTALVGSTYISGSGEDLYLVVWVEPDNFIGWGEGNDIELLQHHGYTATGRDSGCEDDFATFRKGDVNLMLTYDRDFFRSLGYAAEVCKYVNAMLLREHGHGLTKVHRIKVHRILMNEETA